MASHRSDSPRAHAPPPPSPADELIHVFLNQLEQARARHPAADRPHVTLAYAQSVDGSIARHRGERFAISGPEALCLTHALRGRHDAILVGVGTVLADDPLLSVRLARGADPQPVVVDSSLRTPPEARLLGQPDRPVWIATTGAPTEASHAPGAGDMAPDAAQQPIDSGSRVGRAAALATRGAHLLASPALPNGWVDLVSLLRTLRSRGITRLMVEGGAQIITSFLQARLVDYAVVTVAPLFLGGLAAVGPAASPQGAHGTVSLPARVPNSPSNQTGTPPAGAMGIAGSAVPRLRTWASHRLGDDLVVAGEVHWPQR